MPHLNIVNLAFNKRNKSITLEKLNQLRIPVYSEALVLSQFVPDSVSTKLYRQNLLVNVILSDVISLIEYAQAWRSQLPISQKRPYRNLIIVDYNDNKILKIYVMYTTSIRHISIYDCQETSDPPYFVTRPWKNT